MSETTEHDNYGRRMLEALIKARLNEKIILTARVLDPAFDAKIQARWPGMVKPLSKKP